MKYVQIKEIVNYRVDLEAVLSDVSFDDVMEVMNPNANEVMQHFDADDLIQHLGIDDVLQHYDLSDVISSMSPDIDEVCDAMGVTAKQIVSELTCDWDSSQILDAVTEEQRNEIALRVFDIEIQKASNNHLVNEIVRRISGDQLRFDQEELVFKMLLEKFNALLNAVNE